MMRNLSLWAGALALAVALPGAASADCTPDTVATGQTTIEEPLVGIYTVEKTVSVFAEDNCGNPAPLAGQFTYVYSIAVTSGSTPTVAPASQEIHPAGLNPARGPFHLHPESR